MIRTGKRRRANDINEGGGVFSPALRLRLRARLGTARLVAPAVRLEKKAGYSTPRGQTGRGDTRRTRSL